MKILFVCSGNTGRSPMAQFIMQKLINDAGLNEKITVSSAASKQNATGNLHEGIAAKLRAENIPYGEHTAHTITKDDYDVADLIICMDASNVEQVKAIVGGDSAGKIKMLLCDKDIPWDKNGFSKTYDDILRGCKDLLSEIA